jgi:hypothetical protein
MSDAKATGNTASWREVELSAKEARTNRGHAWACTQCEFIIGGPTIERPPSRCPLCAVAAGFPVAVVPAEGKRLSVLVLDRRFVELVDAYRTAKRAHAAESAAHDVIGHAGNYDLDTPGQGGDADSEASAAREQRSALALADATLERSPQRTSRSSVV